MISFRPFGMAKWKLVISVIFLDIVNLIQVELSTMFKLIKLYPFILLKVTLGQGHSIIRQLKVNTV